MTLNLVQGDLSPIIILKPSSVDLAGKALAFEVNPIGRSDVVTLTALLQPNGDVHVPLEAGFTDVPGLYYGQLVIVGEQVSFDRVQIQVRRRAS